MKPATSNPFTRRYCIYLDKDYRDRSQQCAGLALGMCSLFTTKLPGLQKDFVWVDEMLRGLACLHFLRDQGFSTYADDLPPFYAPIAALVPAPLTEQVEQVDARRLELLAELSRLRKISLKLLVEQLDLQPHRHD